MPTAAAMKKFNSLIAKLIEFGNIAAGDGKDLGTAHSSKPNSILENPLPRGKRQKIKASKENLQ